ncbi:MAG: response regulator [Thermodesulfobacteriota bacterium]
MEEKPVLVVDDENQILTMCRKALSRNGYLPFVARSPDAAMKILQERNIPVAFIDLHLHSRTDGVQLGRQIRKHDPSIQLYAMSGYASQGMRVECEQVGFIRFLEKPVSIHQLLSILEEEFKRTTSKKVNRPE